MLRVPVRPSFKGRRSRASALKMRRPATPEPIPCANSNERAAVVCELRSLGYADTRLDAGLGAHEYSFTESQVRRADCFREATEQTPLKLDCDSNTADLKATSTQTWV